MEEFPARDEGKTLEFIVFDEQPCSETSSDD